MVGYGAFFYSEYFIITNKFFFAYLFLLIILTKNIKQDIFYADFIFYGIG